MFLQSFELCPSSGAAEEPPQRLLGYGRPQRIRIVIRKLKSLRFRLNVTIYITFQLMIMFFTSGNCTLSLRVVCTSCT